jgi:hypothetical protein
MTPMFAMGVFAVLHGDAFEAAVSQLQRILKPGGVLITRDSIAQKEDLVRRVKDGYHAHYRCADHFTAVFRDVGLVLRRSVYLESFTNVDNYFFVFERPV